jgi:DNA-binding response OmpR family regulator
MVAWVTMRIESLLVEALRAADWDIKAFVQDEFLPAKLSQAGEVDLIVFELANGFWVDLCREICRKKTAPMLTIAANLAYAQAALEAGADDFMIEPIDPLEVSLRMRTLVRASTIVRVGELEIDLAAWRVSVGGRRVRLSPVEFRLLACLAKRAGEMVNHATIVEEVWGWEAEHGSLTQVKNYIARLRRRVEPDPRRPQFIVSIPGEGYRLRNHKQWEENRQFASRSRAASEPKN